MTEAILIDVVVDETILIDVEVPGPQGVPSSPAQIAAAVGGTIISPYSPYVGRSGLDRARDAVNLLDFGIGRDDGVDVRIALKRAAEEATGLERKLKIPAGNYLVDSIDVDAPSSYDAAVLVVTDGSLEIEMDVGAKLIAGPNLIEEIAESNGFGAMFRVEKSSEAAIGGVVSLKGGRFDQTLVPIQEGFAGVDMFSVGPKYDAALIDGTVFDHGIVATTNAGGMGRGGGDSSIFIKEPEFVSITNCLFLGSGDLGVYLSGDNAEGRYGRYAYIAGNRFYRCNNAWSAKRRFDKTILAGNFVIECGNGFLLSPTGSSQENTGKSTLIANNYILRTQGDPVRLRNAPNCKVIGNTILDYRRWIHDGTTETQTGSGNHGGAIKLAGIDGFEVCGNTLGFDQWEPGDYPTEKLSAAVNFEDYDTGSEVIGTKNGIVSGNRFTKLTMAYFSGARADNIITYPNLEVDIAQESIWSGHDNMPFVGWEADGLYHIRSDISASVDIAFGFEGNDALIKGGLNNDIILRTLGNSGSEGIIFQADPEDAGSPVEIGRLYRSGSNNIFLMDGIIRPATASVYDLGASALPWRTAYVQNMAPVVNTYSGDHTVTEANGVILVNASSGNRTVTLPSPAANARRMFTVKKIDSSGNTVTLSVDGGANIDGSTTYVLSSQWQTVAVQSNGTQYYVL